MRLSRLLAGVALLLTAFTAGSALTPEAQVIPSLQPQAVQVRMDYGTCSGVWISDEHVLTAKHCTLGSWDVEFEVRDFAGGKHTARLALQGEGRGINHDWAILAVTDYKSPVWATASCGPVQYGQSIIGIGNALGETGLLVYLGKVHEPSYDSSKLPGMGAYWKHGILTNLHGGPGVSGGPVWNLDGELIGLMVGALAPPRIGLIQEITYPTEYISILCGDHKD